MDDEQEEEEEEYHEGEHARPRLIQDRKRSISLIDDDLQLRVDRSAASGFDTDRPPGLQVLIWETLVCGLTVLLIVYCTVEHTYGRREKTSYVIGKIV